MADHVDGRPDGAVVVGVLSAAAPVVMGGFFLLLAVTFDYPDVMDRVPAQVLLDIADAGTLNRWLWGGVCIGALALFALSVALPGTVAPRAPAPVVAAVAAMGGLAALFMVLDLSQWVWVYPQMAADHAAATGDVARQVAIEDDWQALHQYVGEGIGRFLATWCSGLWALGVGVLQRQARFGRPIVGLAGIVSGVAFLASGIPGLAFGIWSVLNSVGFVVWFAWLIVTGALLVGLRLPLVSVDTPQ